MGLVEGGGGGFGATMGVGQALEMEVVQHIPTQVPAQA